VIRLFVMLYVRFPLSLRNVEDLLFTDARTAACHSNDESERCSDLDE